MKLGKVSAFPPLPGQSYPPTRRHPRWKEVHRLHDQWIMKYWPFNSEQSRARLSSMDIAGFTTWTAPTVDFDRLVRIARLNGAYILADDCIDSGKMLDRIPGFKKVATGTGPLHPQDRMEICHDIVFRDIQATCHPRTFAQLTKCAHEFWDSHFHKPFENLDQYLSIRRVNSAMYFGHAGYRYALDINLSDEHVNHPLMREAEGIVCDHVGLANDFFSYAKERLTKSDETNVLRILQECEGHTYPSALKFVENLIRQKEQDFISAALAVLNNPEFGNDPEVHRWMACLPYVMGGNMAWMQESGRYNLGDLGDIPFPFLHYQIEETPIDEVVDDTGDSALRKDLLNGPLPDFTDDILPIEAGI